MDNSDGKKWVEGDWSQVEQIERKKVQSDDTPIVLEKSHQRFYDKLREKIAEFIRKQAGDRMDAVTKYILLAPDFFVLLARLVQDKRVSAKTKALAGFAVAYFISPVDFLPELITGPLGFLDDIIFAAYALSRIVNGVDRAVVLEHWNGETDLLQTIQELLHKAEELIDHKVLAKIKNLFSKK